MSYNCSRSLVASATNVDSRELALLPHFHPCLLALGSPPFLGSDSCYSLQPQPRADLTIVLIMPFYSVFLMVWRLGALLAVQGCPSQGQLVCTDSRTLTWPKECGFRKHSNQSRAHTPVPPMLAFTLQVPDN